MNLTELSNTIADCLEREAALEKNKKVNAVQDYYKGYIQACEDFGRQLRQRSREAGSETGQDAAAQTLQSAT